MTTTLSMVFDARKRAEQSQRGRGAIPEAPQPTEAGARSPAPQDAAPADEWGPDSRAAKGAVAQQSPLVRSLLRVPRLKPSSAALSASEFAQQGGSNDPPTLILREDPIYPAIAKQRLISGSVEVHFRISPEGKVYDVKSVKGSPILAQAAVEAVEGWCYEPARRNGNPIDSQASTNFDFQLA